MLRTPYATAYHATRRPTAGNLGSRGSFPSLHPENWQVLQPALAAPFELSRQLDSNPQALTGGTSPAHEQPVPLCARRLATPQRIPKPSFAGRRSVSAVARVAPAQAVGAVLANQTPEVPSSRLFSAKVSQSGQLGASRLAGILVHPGAGGRENETLLCQWPLQESSLARTVKECRESPCR